MDEQPIPQEAAEIQHKVTDADLVNNPELKEVGVEVGETIGIPATDTEAPAEGAALVAGPEEGQE
jgi:hypothetical protein